MQREIQLTADGSHTVSLPGLGITYHSRHGAIGESMHVFIDAGLLPLMNTLHDQPIRILEIGFGTGLNALLTAREAISRKKQIQYTALEPFPLLPEETALINHGSVLSMQDIFRQLHNANWEETVYINEFFRLEKKKLSVLHPLAVKPVHCIYFDVFAPLVQPELWTQAVFKQLYTLLAPSGTLLTYSSKSEIRRAMTAVGFNVTKIPGPWGKREMVRATRLDD